MASPAAAESGGTFDSRPVLFFDIDNCLYSRNTRVYDLMAKLIDQYFAKYLCVSEEEAIEVHKEYYKNYGLAIEGMVRHHADFDPLHYNSKVDDALSLEDLIKPSPELRRLLQDIDTTNVKPWLLTNAYINHGKRVVKLLGVDDLFEGLTYCDYSSFPIICKPHNNMYAKAMKEARVERAEDCYFVDDSYPNCEGAKKMGWTAAHLVEEGLTLPQTPASQHQIRNLIELRMIFPQFFKKAD